MSSTITEFVRTQPLFASLRAKGSSLGQVLASHRPLFEVLAIYVSAAMMVDAAVPEASILRLHFYDAVFALMVQVYVVGFLAMFALLERRHVPSGHSVLAWYWRRLRERYLNAARIGGFLCAVVYGRLLTDTFTSFKSAIPLLYPYTWDETFMRWDRALHGGHHAWEWLELLMIPIVTVGLNVVYNAWMFVLFGVFMWQAWSANERLRRRFFVTFGLVWALLGTAAATGFSSVGPCYYGRIAQSADDPYAPLMRYLREVDAVHHLWALDVQEALWKAYSRTHEQISATGPGNNPGRSGAGKPGAGVPVGSAHAADVADGIAADAATGGTGAIQAAGTVDAASVEQMLDGISAMPSMHVAMAVLFALLGWSVNRGAGVAFTLFAISIQIGSVALGWHYAIDGYASAIAVTLLWLVVGRSLGAPSETA